jgi:hypothetical protein
MTPLSLARGFVVIIDGITMQYLADRGHRRAHREAFAQLIDGLLTSAGA